MSWLKRAIGGNKKGLKAAIDDLLASGQPVDCAALADQYHVKPEKAEELFHEAARPVFFAELGRLLAAGDYTASSGESVGARLGLSPDVSRSMAHEFATARIEIEVEAALADAMVTADERAALDALAATLGVDVPAHRRQEVLAGEAIWFAGNMPLPIVDPPLLLKSSEVCHHAAKAEAVEDRQRTVRVNYQGVSARVKIVKGVYYNVGTVQAERVAEGYQHSFGTGVFCATNKRLLWISGEKVITIPLGKIVAYEVFGNAIKIFKDTGKPLTFFWGGTNKIASIYAARVIEELR